MLKLTPKTMHLVLHAFHNNLKYLKLSAIPEKIKEGVECVDDFVLYSTAQLAFDLWITGMDR